VQVPARFAQAIPSDLVATIVRRRKRLHAQHVVLVCRDDTVVGLVDPAKWTHTRARVHYCHAESGEHDTDRALGVPAARRQSILAQVRRRQATLRHVGAAAPARPIDVAGDTVFTALTATARDETAYRRHLALQRLAGGLLHAYGPGRGTADRGWEDRAVSAATTNNGR
jgi:hypothetical protein